MANHDESLSFEIDGPAAIYYGPQMCTQTIYTTSGRTLLGMTDGGVTISSRVITHRINGDEYGGSEGVPAELLILGGQGSIRASIVKWNGTDFKHLANGAYLTGDEGQIPALGKTYFGNKHGFSFWVVGKSLGYFFPKCELATQPREWNVSSLERRMQLNVNAYNIFVNNACVIFLTHKDTFTPEAACMSGSITHASYGGT